MNKFREMSYSRVIAAILLAWLLHAAARGSDSVYFANGFKMGEMTPTSVVVWTRLCGAARPVKVWHERKEPPFRSPVGFDDRMPVGQMDGAVPGAFGQVRVILACDGRRDTIPWEHVSSYMDHTYKKHVTGLKPNTLYQIVLEGRAGPGLPVSSASGRFRTAPDPGEAIPVLFTSTSCQYFWDFDDPGRGFRIYDSMLELDPLFHCQTGDFVYYDKPGPMARSVELARHKWHANNGWPSVIDFYAVTPVYLQKDDHDMMSDDASPGMEPFGELGFGDGKQVWYEQAPLTGKPYRTFRWGRDLQVWVVEGREFRSDNWVPDGPGKSIWGEEQKAWFVNTVSASDATFKILVSPTPVVGPDRARGKNDNHANKAFGQEGGWLRKFLGEHGMYVINGDRHWQYVSRDQATGVMEFSQGPSSDSHAQGWDQEDVRPEHRFLRVRGGFLSVKVDREEGPPRITFTHYDVDGQPVHETALFSGIE